MNTGNEKTIKTFNKMKLLENPNQTFRINLYSENDKLGKYFRGFLRIVFSYSGYILCVNLFYVF